MVSYTSSLPEINKNKTIRNYFNNFSNATKSQFKQIKLHLTFGVSCQEDNQLGVTNSDNQIQIQFAKKISK